MILHSKGVLKHFSLNDFSTFLISFFHFFLPIINFFRMCADTKCEGGISIHSPLWVGF